jgi:predicted esterase
MMREAKRVAPKGWAIASLQGPHQHYRQGKDGGYRVGFGWLSDYKSEESVKLHHQFILDVIEKLATDGVADRNDIYLYGFSQACALNFRFALTYPAVLKAIIGVCGGIPGDLDSNPVYRPFDAKCFYLFGDDDEFYTQEQFLRFDERLRSDLPNYRSKHYAAKHEITDDMREDISLFLRDA